MDSTNCISQPEDVVTDYVMVTHDLHMVAVPIPISGCK